MKESAQDAGREPRGRLRRYMARAHPAGPPIGVRIAPVVLLAASLFVVYFRMEPWVHVGTVRGAACSWPIWGPLPAGRIVCGDGRVVDAATGDILCHLEPPEGQEFRRVVLWHVSRDGRRLATVTHPDAAKEDEAEAIRVWDAETGRLLVRLARDRAGASGGQAPGPIPVFAPDGSRLLTLAPRSSVWDLDDGSQLFSFKGWASFSPDSLLIAAADGEEIRLIESATGRETSRLEAARDVSGAPAFAPDGATVMACLGGPVQVWDIETGRPVMFLPGEWASSSMASYSASGTLLVVWRWEWSIEFGPLVEPVVWSTEIWDAETGEFLQRFGGCGFGLVSSDGRRVAGVTRGYLPAVWDAATGELLCELPSPPAWRVCLLEGDDDALVVVENESAFRLPADRPRGRFPDETVHYFRRRHPEWWWGHLCRPEVWVSVLLGVLCLLQAFGWFPGRRLAPPRSSEPRSTGGGGP